MRFTSSSKHRRVLYIGKPADYVKVLFVIPVGAWLVV
jgi:hypothetical protein